MTEVSHGHGLPVIGAQPVQIVPGMWERQFFEAMLKDNVVSCGLGSGSPVFAGCWPQRH